LGHPPPPPPVRPPTRWARAIDPTMARRAIETVKNALPYMVFGPPLIHRGPAGDVHVDVPLMYHEFALDRVHYDPVSKAPSPKGRPVHVWGGIQVDPNEVSRIMEEVLRELRVIEAAEFREPEDAWVVPLAWRTYIVAHIRVSSDGTQLIPDYPLTAEVQRYIL